MSKPSPAAPEASSVISIARGELGHVRGDRNTNVRTTSSAHRLPRKLAAPASAATIRPPHISQSSV
jgi:hypothetical protein